MFNQGRFNRNRFNRRTGTEINLLVSACFATACHAMIVRGGNLYASAAFQTQAGYLGILTTAAPYRMALKNQAEQLVKGSIRAMAKAAFLGEMDQRARLGGRWAPPVTLTGGLAIRAVLGGNALSAIAMETRTNALLRHGLNAFIGRLRFNSFMDMQATTQRFAIQYAILDLDVPPGGTLVLDSGSYTALLDGENVLHAHQGDWLFLNRETHDLTMEALDGSPIEAEKAVLYMERWI